MKISIFNHGGDTLPGTAEVSWSDVAESLANVRSAPCALNECVNRPSAGDHKRTECPHKGGRGWSPVEYAAGATRGLRGVVSVHAMVVDLDHVPDDVLPELLGRIQEYRRIVHASHSDRPGDRCLRVVLDVSRPILASEYPRFWRGVMTMLGLPADESTKDASRLYYTPSRPSDACDPEIVDGNGFVFECADGIALNVDVILATVPETATATLKSEFIVPVRIGDDVSEDSRQAAIEALADAWPANGRHRATLALAGALARAGWDEDAITTFMFEVRERAQSGNGDLSKCSGQARSSVQKVQANENVAGWPTVQELLGVAGRNAVNTACNALGVGLPAVDPDFLVELFAKAPPGTLGAPGPSRVEVADAVRASQRKLGRAGTPEKVRDHRLLTAILKGLPLSSPDDNDHDRVLTAAAVALARAVPDGTTDEQLAELLGGSALGRGHDELIKYAHASRTQVKAEHARRLESKKRKEIEPVDHVGYEMEISGKFAGRPMADSAPNVRLALDRMDIDISFDEFAERVMVSVNDTKPERLNNNHISCTPQDIENQFKFRPSKDLMSDVFAYQAREHKYHPVREYLSELKWDGIPRINTWLIDLAGAPDTPYTRAVSRLFLVAACRRVQKPGCKFDEMLVLESPQGTNKSSALRVLAVRDEWFGDDLRLDGDTKQQMEQTAGKWIIEAGELRGMSQGDHNALKAYLSRQSDTARMAYARESHERLRQFVICGSTNDSRYLKDDTGNRRYLPVAIVGFDLERLRELRDQLWAEAHVYEQAGESIRLDPVLYEAAAAEQKEREIEDTYEIQLAPVLGSLVGKIRIQEVWKITGGDIPKIPSNAEQARITSAMKKLGWERERRRTGGDRGHVYVRGTKVEQGVQLHVVGGPLGWSVTTTASAGTGIVVARPAN